MHQGVMHEKLMHFYAQNASPGLYERRNESMQKKIIFFGQPKMGVIHQGGYTSGITVDENTLSYTHLRPVRESTHRSHSYEPVSQLLSFWKKNESSADESSVNVDRLDGKALRIMFGHVRHLSATLSVR